MKAKARRHITPSLVECLWSPAFGKVYAIRSRAHLRQPHRRQPLEVSPLSIAEILRADRLRSDTVMCAQDGDRSLAGIEVIRGSFSPFCKRDVSIEHFLGATI